MLRKKKMEVYLAENTRTLTKHWGENINTKSSGKEVLRHHLVLTQSIPMNHYLQTSCSTQRGVSMGIELVFPQQLVDILHRIFFPESYNFEPTGNVFSVDSMHLRISNILTKLLPHIFSSRPFDTTPPKKKPNFLDVVLNAAWKKKRFYNTAKALLFPKNSDEAVSEAILQTRIIRLAHPLALCFDEYQAYRHQLLKKWQSSEPYILEVAQNKTKTSTSPQEILNFQHVLWKILRSEIALSLKKKSNNISKVTCTGQLQKLQQLHGAFSSAATDPKRNSELSAMFFNHYISLTTFGVNSLPPLLVSLLPLLSRCFHSNQQSPLRLYLLGCCEATHSKSSTKKTSTTVLQNFLTQLKKHAQLIWLPSTNPQRHTDKILAKTENYHNTSAHLLTLLSNHFTTGAKKFTNMEENVFSTLPEPYEKKQNDTEELLKNSKPSSAGLLQPISLLRCNNKTQEIESIANLLLYLLGEDENKSTAKENKNILPLQASDVLLMCPQVDDYSSEIINTFTRYGLPVSITDERIENQRSLEAELLQFLRFLKTPITPNSFIAILKGKFFANKNELQNIQPLVLQMFCKFHIRHQNDEKFFSQTFNPHSFQKGMTRFFQQYINGVENSSIGQNQSFDGIGINQHHADSLAKIFNLLNELLVEAQKLKTMHSITFWIENVKHLLQKFLVKKITKDAPNVLEALHSIKVAAQLAENATSLTFSAALHLLTQKLTCKENQRGFMLGHITVSSLVPMRAIPFKVICMLSMDEDSFPRHSPPRPFSNVYQHPQPGDRSLESDDEQTFSESFLCAENFLIFSYVENSLEGEKVLKRSLTPLLFNALASALTSNCNIEAIIQNLTLSDELLQTIQYSTFNKQLRKVNQTLQSKKIKTSTHFYLQTPKLWPFTNPNNNSTKDDAIAQESCPVQIITLEDLKKFFKHPLEFSKRNEQVTLADVRSQDVYDTEPLEQLVPTGKQNATFVGDFSKNRYKRDYLQNDLFWKQPKILPNHLPTLLELPQGILGKKILEESNAQLKETHEYCEKIADGIVLPPFTAKKNVCEAVHFLDENQWRLCYLNNSFSRLLFGGNKKLHLFHLADFYSNTDAWKNFLNWLLECLFLNHRPSQSAPPTLPLTSIHFPNYASEKEIKKIETLLLEHSTQQNFVEGHYVATTSKKKYHFSFICNTNNNFVVNHALRILLECFSTCAFPTSTTAPPISNKQPSPLLAMLPTCLSSFILNEEITSTLYHAKKYSKFKPLSSYTNYADMQSQYSEELTKEKILSNDSPAREEFWHSHESYINQFLLPLYQSEILQLKNSTL